MNNHCSSGGPKLTVYVPYCDEITLDTNNMLTDVVKLHPSTNNSSVKTNIRNLSFLDRFANNDNTF
jgi:hypothetical protein